MSRGSVTLIRFASRQLNAVTYVACYADKTVDILSHVLAQLGQLGLDTSKNFSIDTAPWEALPGIRQLAALRLAFEDPGTVLFVGTIADGQWTMWNPGGTPPPVPEADREMQS